MKLLIASHNDDEALWCAFTIMREQPLVVIVFDGYLQQRRGAKVTPEERRIESWRAMRELSCWTPIFLCFPDTAAAGSDLESRIAIALKRLARDVDAVWAPAEEQDGHEQHNLVARAATAAFGLKIVDRYLSYTRTGGKSTSARPVPIESGEWIRRKLRALSCYVSQIDIEALGCREHFLGDQREYYAT